MPKKSYAFAQSPNGVIIVLDALCFDEDTLPWSFARADCVDKGGDPATVFFVEQREALETPALRAVIDAYRAAFHAWMIERFGLSDYSS